MEPDPRPAARSARHDVGRLPGALAPDTDLAGLTDADLEDEIVTWAGRIAAGEARLLTLIAEFDQREAWGHVGMLSCAHWLSLHLGLGIATAREKVRVARALVELPQVAAALGSGRMSYAQVRAVSRVATAQDQQTWVELARQASGAQLEKLARGVRRARKVDEDAADPERARWRADIKTRYDDDGTMVITVRLPAEEGAVLLAGIERSQDLLAPADATGGSDRPDVSAEASGTVGGIGDQRAPGDQAAGVPRPSRTQAFLHLIRTALEHLGAARPESARRSRSRLTVQVDPLSGWARLPDGEFLPPAVVRPIVDTSPGLPVRSRIRPIRPADLRREDLGRDPAHRVPSLALRELLGVVDGEHCRFPGCTRRRNLHAHHVVFWRNGGPTDLANLVLVCSRHHTLIHQEGFALVLRPDRSLTVHTAGGAPVLHHPPLPWRPAVDLDPAGSVTAAGLPLERDEKPLDLGYAVSVLCQQAA
ncbi:MAG: endonuclease [Frankiales bacterium]|nr:endonuclease [Frankiales bacterium]